MAPMLGLRTLVVADAASAVPAKYLLGSRIVQTALDLVRALDERFERVVLVGAFACDRAYARFIREADPSLDVIAVSERADTPVQLQAVFV